MTMTTETSHADVIVGLYTAVATGRPDAALPHLADDVVLHVPGGQPLAGDHVGPEAVVAFITASSAVADRTEHVEVLDVLVGGAHAAAYCHVTGSRPGGPDLDNRTVHLFRITDGRIAEVWFHNWDQAAVDAFWS
jgi:ketosteroid isomerase-like protein